MYSHKANGDRLPTAFMRFADVFLDGDRPKLSCPHVRRLSTSLKEIINGRLCEAFEITTINLNARSLCSLKVKGESKTQKTYFLKKSFSLRLSLSFAPLR
ncbi:MAG: hypothetical protein H7Y05_08240 [Steroidobacteraceae bacterium]|nr:hypothetical protein [Deltaproteobacteria bacterium]